MICKEGAKNNCLQYYGGEPELQKGGLFGDGKTQVSVRRENST